MGSGYGFQYGIQPVKIVHPLQGNIARLTIAQKLCSSSRHVLLRFWEYWHEHVPRYRSLHPKLAHRDLEEASRIAELDPDEILWALEEEGICETDRFVVADYVEPAYWSSGFPFSSQRNQDEGFKTRMALDVFKG